MKTIFLASGKSSRMVPLQEKNLLSFYGKPLCVHLLERAKSGGCGPFVIVTNGENTQALQRIVTKYDIDAEIVVQQDLSQGMAGGISDALALIKDDEPVLIAGGNDAIEPSAYVEVQRHVQQGATAVILAKQVTEYFPGGYISLKPGSHIIESIVEKPGEGNEPSNLINIVCHGFLRAGDLKESLKNAQSSADDVYEVALDTLFQRGDSIAFRYKNDWQAIKYPWHILDMAPLLMPHKTNKKIDASTQIHQSAVIGPDVIIGRNAKVFPFSTITGQTYIGENTVIGNGALVRDSHIGANCTIGFQSEVARSWLAHNVSTHMAYVGDSVIAENVNMGAFSCTANLRLDACAVKVKRKGVKVSSQRTKLGAIIGSGAQIGIHASLMPGAVVPCETLVYPGSVYPPRNEEAQGKGIFYQQGNAK